jgi:hypothetical protein
VVEHRLAKARVASSNLVSRSRPPSGASRAGYGGLGAQTQEQKAALPRRGTQVVRERSAKPLCAGSIPARASKFLNNLAHSDRVGQKPTVADTVAGDCRFSLNHPSRRFLFWQHCFHLPRRVELL